MTSIFISPSLRKISYDILIFMIDVHPGNWLSYILSQESVSKRHWRGRHDTIEWLPKIISKHSSLVKMKIGFHDKLTFLYRLVCYTSLVPRFQNQYHRTQRLMFYKIVKKHFLEWLFVLCKYLDKRTREFMWFPKSSLSGPHDPSLTKDSGTGSLRLVIWVLFPIHQT